MQKLIDTVSSFYASGIQTQNKLFKVPSGQYKGRAISVYPLNSTTLVYRWADPPYISWSEPVNIITNSADFPASGFMDSSGNVYLTYTLQTSLTLAMVKLSFVNGAWSIGTVRNVCTVGNNYYPSILKDSINRLWVSWSYYDPVTTRYSVHVKSSTDDGITWGTGEADPGEALTSGSTGCFSQLIFQPSYLRCFYSDGGDILAYRSFELYSAVWSSAVSVYSGSNIQDDFQVSVSPDNKVGIVFPGNSALLYREFDGLSWSGVMTVDTAVPVSPAIKFSGNVPYVLYGKNIGNNQNQIFYSYKSGSNFVTPIPFLGGAKILDKVFCYDHSATNKYTDRTSEAQNATSADIFHPTSSSLIRDIEDALYLGMNDKFNQARIILSTAGIGGQVVWEYWDGSEWKSFTPYSGAYHLDSLSKLVILWQDLSSVPSDWQMCGVNNSTFFWVRIRVTTGYATAPVGTQITAVPESKYINAV
ncbi:MAG: hypothetical protein MUP17_00560 [candidate division Zixibacteria bacterium]|nr:hypothetical protein [candidate division Zixibacteria bacterium]